MSDITFSAQIVTDRFQIYRVNSDAPAGSALRDVFRHLSENKEKTNFSEYRIFIAHQLVITEIPLEKLISEDNLANPDVTLQDAKLQNGFYVFFVKPNVTTTKLQLWWGEKCIKVVDKPDFLVGRADAAAGIEPDLDLTEYLGKYERKVSRRQAIIFEENVKWKIRLDSQANSPVFVNNLKLEPGLTPVLDNESMISFGNSPEQAYLRLTTKIVSE
jgi:hypothetical protein